MHKLLLLLITVVVLSSALILISPAHFQTGTTETKSVTPTPSISTAEPIETGLCGKAIYVYGARKSENAEFEKSEVSTSLELRALNGKLISQTKSSSDGSFFLKASPGEYLAYISDYGVKQRVTIQDGKCTNTNLYVNAP